MCLFFYFLLFCFVSFLFFFQAEDGIRDRDVTGVQTCALPISGSAKDVFALTSFTDLVGCREPLQLAGMGGGISEIGRASCRERVYISVVAVSLKKKKTKSNSVNDTENSM